MTRDSDRRHQIDLMVDGELSTDQERQLLLYCQEHPQLWRELALAFVESRTWKSHLTGWWETTKLDAIGGPGREGQTAVAEQVRHAVAPATGSTRMVGQRTPLWSLAMLMLVSLVAGYGLGLWWQDGRAIGVAQHGPSSPVQPATGSLGAARSTGANSLQLMVRDPAANEFRQIDVPLVQAADLGPGGLGELPAAMPAKAIERIQFMGNDVRQRRRYVPVRLLDGRQVLLPVDEIQVDLWGYQ